MHLDNILLSGIRFRSWAWSLSSNAATDAADASTNGCRAKALKASREFVRSAKAPIGISRESIKLKGGSNDLSKIWRRERGLNPRPGARPVLWFCRPPHYHSGISPLKAASRDIASQTFAPYSQCKSFLEILINCPASLIEHPISALFIGFLVDGRLTYAFTHRIADSLCGLCPHSALADDPIRFFAHCTFNRGNPLIPLYASALIPCWSNLALFFKSLESIVDGNQFLFVFGEVKTASNQFIAYLWNWDNSSFSKSKNSADCVRKINLEGGSFNACWVFIARTFVGLKLLYPNDNFHVWREAVANIFRNDAQTINHSFPIKDLLINFSSLCYEFVQFVFGFCESGFYGISHGE